MSAFSSRSSGYKAGVLLMVLAFCVFVVGYGAPYWASKTTQYGTSFGGAELKIHEGPLMLCVSASAFGYSSTSCSSYEFSGLAGWFHAVRSLEGICLVLLIIACIYALATNCCRTFPGPVSRVLEILLSLGGVAGLVGVIVYGALRNDEDTRDSAITLDAYVLDDLILGGGSWTMDWALYLAGVGSGLSLVAAVLVGVFNREVAQPAGGAVIGMTTIATTQHQAQYPAYAGSYPAHAGGYPAHAGAYPGYAGYPAGGQAPQQGYGYPAKHY